MGRDARGGRRDRMGRQTAMFGAAAVSGGSTCAVNVRRLHPLLCYVHGTLFAF